MKFIAVDKLEPCDVLFVALPHGVAMGKMASLREKAPIIIDLSADFRLNDPAGYPTWYDHEHSDPGMLDDFVYGIPELHREEIADGEPDLERRGCMATTAILGIYPLFRAGVVDLEPSGRDRSARQARPVPAARRDSARTTRSAAARSARSSRPVTATRPKSSRN